MGQRNGNESSRGGWQRQRREPEVGRGPDDLVGFGMKCGEYGLENLFYRLHRDLRAAQVTVNLATYAADAHGIPCNA